MLPLMTVRAALVVLVAVVVSAIAFGLAYCASPSKNIAGAALVAGGAAGGTLIVANQVLGA